MWPDRVLRQFNTIPTNPSESDYYGSYNKLLHTLFPADSDFVVVPQYLPDSRNLADFIFTFEIFLVNKPVLILQLKPPSYLNLLSKRQAADEQIRSRMADLVSTCPLKILHGISVIPRHPTRVNDTAPAVRWSYDILERSGEQRLRAIVQEIKDGCVALEA